MYLCYQRGGGSHFGPGTTLRYDPCSVRGGARRSLVSSTDSLTYPPSPNYSLLSGAFGAGDCGPGAVVVVVTLMCELFPTVFDVAKVPKYAIEVRCLLAVLLVNSTLFESHFQSADSSLVAPRPGTLFSGILHSARFQPNLAEVSDSVAWRKRLALMVCPGEGTRGPDGRRGMDSRLIVWFTLDVVFILVGYLLQQAFLGSSNEFADWCVSRGPARHSHGPICYVPGVAPWCVPMEQTVPVNPFDLYAICVLHVGTHFQVHVRRTRYMFGGITASTSPYQDYPGRYDCEYTRAPREYQKYVTDPQEFAHVYVERYNAGFHALNLYLSESILSFPPLVTSSSSLASGGALPQFLSVRPDERDFRLVEPVETSELVVGAQNTSDNQFTLANGFPDFPVRFSSFGDASRQLSKHGVTVARDANFELAFRPRFRSGAPGDDPASMVPRGNPNLMGPVSGFISETRLMLATGPSTILGEGLGTFVFDVETFSHSGDTVIEAGEVVGWFDCLALHVDDLPFTLDSSIVELIFHDGPRYFVMNVFLSSVQCVWLPDDVVGNNCGWISADGRLGVRSLIPFVNCQECLLPFGWTSGPTRNKSPSVCYQIWKGNKDTILKTRSPFYHRLAWLLSKGFLDPSPRHLMRKAWGMQEDPPDEALVSCLSYTAWIGSLQSLSGPVFHSSVNAGCSSERSSESSGHPQLITTETRGVVSLAQKRKRPKSRQRRRIAAAVLRSSVDSSVSACAATGELDFSSPSRNDLVPQSDSAQAKRQKSLRHAWGRWERRYRTAQQQTWAALQVLASEPSELHFSDQLREIAAEFSATPDCSDTSEYIAQQRAEGKLMHFSFEQMKEDEAFIMTNGLEKLIESRFVKFPGLGYDSLFQFVEERGLCLEKREKLFELLEFGQTPYMLDTFTPNGCSKSVKNGIGYSSHRDLCEHTAAKLYSESRCLLVREDLLVSRYLTGDLHVSPCNTVHKEGAVKRVVTDLSHGKDKISSYNHSVDLEKHLNAYPRNSLPTLRHVATLACQMRREHPGAGLLHGGVVDVRTAYQQYRLSMSKAKLVCTRLFSRRKIKGADQEVAVIMIALTGTFGDVGAGDTYAILGDVFHELHNAVWALWRSVTYVDDMLILAPPMVAKPHPFQLQTPFPVCDGVYGGSADGAPQLLEGAQYLIHQAVTYARNLIGNVLGAQATEPRKSKWFYGCLIGIGWYFNLVYSEFYVLPKPEKLRKIVHYLFNVIPVGSELAPYSAVRELQGLLCWFSAALPLGKSFVYSLFRCRPNRDGVVAFSSIAIRDMDFWRSLARCAMIHPNLFGTKLENLEFGRRPTWFVRTDASTGHGGGGWLSKSESWVPGAPESRCFALRWTAEELTNINKWLKEVPRPSSAEDIEVLQGNLHHYCSDGTVPQAITVTNLFHGVVAPEAVVADLPVAKSLNINMLEFATAVFAMMLWAPVMQGSCVCIGADNTATLCWLVKHKTTNLASDVILKLLALTCAVYNIQLVTEFIPGVRNVLADWLSRVSGGDRWDVASEAAELSCGSQGFFRENLHMMAKDPVGFPRRLVSRTILMRSLTVFEAVDFLTLLAMVLALKGVDDFSCDLADVEVKGTMNGIATALSATSNGELRVPMDYADAVARFYFHPGENKESHTAISMADNPVLPTTQTPLPRVLLPRKAKTKAIDAIISTVLKPPSQAYRIPQIKDLPGVQVSVAISTIEGAGFGLFLTSGPSADGSAPAGTRLATYDGQWFVRTADIACIENFEHQSDYLWGKFNPLTRVYSIVDAADPLSCYARYVNEGFFNSNCEVVLGSDDVLYLVATTDISLNEELTMPYGAPFWTLPERWMSIPTFLQESVLQFYDCVPPNVSARVCTLGLNGSNAGGSRSGFGPAYSSDNAGDGPRATVSTSGWGSRQHTGSKVGRGWDSILSSDIQTLSNSRDRMQASFTLLQSQAMATCHAPATLRSYTTGWRSWCRYCEFFRRSPMLEASMLLPMLFHEVITEIQNYIHFECAIRQIQPDSIKNVYLVGIADYFDRQGVVNVFRQASNHNCVQLVLSSYSRSWKKKHPDSSKVKIAFGLSYAIHAERLIHSGALAVGGYVCSDRSNLMLYMIGFRVVTALWMGIFFLLRKSEFLPFSTHPNEMQEPCRRRNLRFFDGNRTEIPYHSIGLRPAASVTLHLRFSKTDQTGHGRIVQHESTCDSSTCIVHRLGEYIRVSRDYFHATADSVLFSVPGLPTDLSSAVLTEVMRGTTAALGLPERLVSAHSLRYGGATALSQAGFPEYIIAFYGGWVAGSTAMRRYIVQSAQTRRVVSDHMAKTAYATSVEDLVRETLAGREPLVCGVVEGHKNVSELEVLMGPAYTSMPRKRKRKN